MHRNIFVSLLLFLGCANNKLSLCSKISSIYVQPKDIAESNIQNFASYGGFIEFKPVTSSLGSVTQYGDSRYCAATLDFDDDNSTHIWTAEHCMRAEENQDSILHLYFSHEYEPIPVVIKAFALAKTILPKSETMDAESRIDLERSIKTALKRSAVGSLTDPIESVSNSAVSQCVSETVAVLDKLSLAAKSQVGDSKLTVSCTNYFELGRFEIELPKVLSLRQSTALDAAKALLNRKKDNALMKIADEFKTINPGLSHARLTEKQLIWKKSIHDLTLQRGLIGTAKLMDEVNGCGTKKCETMRQLFADDWQERQSLGSSLLIKRSGDLRALSKVVNDEWNKILGILPMMGKFPVSLTGNFSMPNEVGDWQQESISVLRKQPSHFMALPYKMVFKSPFLTLQMEPQSNPTDPVRQSIRVLNERESTGGIFVGEHGITVVTSPALHNFIFQMGDSGSIVTWEGLFPLFAFSTSDSKPFSGGAVLRSLPDQKSVEPDAVKSTPGTASTPTAATKNKTATNTGQSNGC